MQRQIKYKKLAAVDPKEENSELNINPGTRVNVSEHMGKCLKADQVGVYYFWEIDFNISCKDVDIYCQRVRSKY